MKSPTSDFLAARAKIEGLVLRLRFARGLLTEAQGGICTPEFAVKHAELHLAQALDDLDLIQRGLKVELMLSALNKQERTT